MTDKKPDKIVYKNQKKIHDLIIKNLKSNYLDNIKEAYIIGSLVNGNFGRYKKRFEGHFGSDIDLVVIPKKINNKWQFLGDFYNWHKKYNVGIIKINKITHPINLMIPFKNNMRTFFKKSKQLNWKMEKIK